MVVSWSFILPERKGTTRYWASIPTKPNRPTYTPNYTVAGNSKDTNVVFSLCLLLLCNVLGQHPNKPKQATYAPNYTVAGNSK